MKDRHQHNLVKLIEKCRYRHDIWSVWRDSCELWALAISNSADQRQFDDRERRYLEIIGKYQADEQQLFPQMFGELVMAMEDNFDDVLGKTFMTLEIGDKWKGQFFTPGCLAHMMATMTLTGFEEKIREQGFITLMEPAVGGGVTVLACAQAMREAGFNYQRQLHVTAVDVDLTCVHMAYVQFALHHIPAVVVHGNSLSLEEWSHWYTPAHILDGWNARLRAGCVAPVVQALETLDDLIGEPIELDLPAMPEPQRVGQLALF